MDAATTPTNEIKQRCLEAVRLAHRNFWHATVTDDGYYTMLWDACQPTTWTGPAPELARVHDQPVVEVLFADLGVAKFLCESNHVARLLFVGCHELKCTEGWIAAAEVYNEKGESRGYFG
jgi:hypothetical protein